MRRLYIAALCLLPVLAVRAQQPGIDSLQLIKDVRTLSADKFEGRKTGTRGNRMAQFYLLDRFKQTGLQPFNGTFEYPFYFNEGRKRVMGTNLYGYIAGKSEDVIVISAHYDHLGTRAGAGNDSIYNGADDNASGVGALLAIARYYKQHAPAHTLIFAAFDGEEEGLQGAKAFLQQPPVPATRIKMNLNMDMVSRNVKQELYVSGTYHYPDLKPYVTEVAAASRIKLLSGHDRPEDGEQDWTKQSDHYPFHQKKIPFLYFGVEDHPDYHKASDEFEKIDPAFYYKAVQTIRLAVETVDQGLLKTKFRSKVIYGK